VIDDAAKVIEVGTVRVSGIVDRLKSFTRLDEAELQRADIHRGIEDALAMASHELGDRIEIARNFAADVPQILCKPGQLNQVLFNVLINAKHAIPDRGRISIETAVVGGTVRIKVKDDGIGIAKEALPRVFEPGFTTKGVGIGMGLGLSIAYRVVQEHGGEIEIASEPGKGTEVTISLPITSSPSAS
jgi:signal transduction histidine kinase